MKNKINTVLITGSLKRKSDVVDASNLNRTSQKLLAFNFASSTPTVNSVNKLPTLSLSKYLFILINTRVLNFSPIAILFISVIYKCNTILGYIQMVEL